MPEAEVSVVRNSVGTILAAATIAAALAVWPAHTQVPAQTRAQAPAPAMSFFVTSVGLGDGANLGGLAGADGHCAFLAAAVGAGGKTWRAYLSKQASLVQANMILEVNARDRIGSGPWHNAVGVEVAADVDALHGEGNNINKATALSERGEVVNGVGDEPNRHDILTGTRPDGKAYDPWYDWTCGNWTSNGPGEVMVGHHDLLGNRAAPSFWNNAHTAGCSQTNLARTGGEGLFYCFAFNEG